MANRSAKQWIIRISITLVVLAFLAGIGIGFDMQGNTELIPTEEIRPVKTVVLQPAATQILRAYPGHIEAAQSVELSFRVSGPLVSLDVKPGQHVVKGDILARIDPRDYELNLENIDSSLAQARAKLKSMAHARPEDLALLKATLVAAEARCALAKLDHGRFSELLKKDSATQAEYDASESVYIIAQAERDRTKQELAKGQAGARHEDIAAMRASIAALEAQRKMAAAALEDSTLRAPYDGRVACKYIENHTFVRASQPIIRFQDISTMEIVIDVPEKMVAPLFQKSLFPQTHATFSFLPGKKFPVTFKYIDTAADPQTRTFEITMTMPTPEGVNLFPGMTGEIVTSVPHQAGREQLFLVPVEAVFVDAAGKQCVWLVDSHGQVHRKELASARTQAGGMLVSGDLPIGGRVVTAGTHFLIENAKVRVLADAEEVTK